MARRVTRAVTVGARARSDKSQASQVLSLRPGGSARAEPEPEPRTDSERR